MIIAGRSASKLEEAKEEITKAVGKGVAGETVVEVHVLDNQDEQQLEAFLPESAGSIISSRQEQPTLEVH